MTLLKTTFAALTTSLILTGGYATPDAHATEFDAETARLDLTYDTNGDGEVTDEELIEGNMDLFDTNGDGIIDAQGRGEA